MTKRAPYLLLTFFLIGATANAQLPASNRASYEADLMKLSETLGALHYLRPICGASEQGQWRVEMQALIDAAELPADKRALLVTSFNRGFLSQERAYRTCTPAARLAAERFFDIGTRLSREIVERQRN
jgi:uncharacterized protein (TIGR02301 family)